MHFILVSEIIHLKGKMEIVSSFKVGFVVVINWINYTYRKILLAALVLEDNGTIKSALIWFSEDKIMKLCCQSEIIAYHP